MKLRLQRSPFLLAAPVVALLSAVFIRPAVAQPPSDDTMVARLRADVQALTRFPSRVPGTQGNVAAAEYVRSRFAQIGLQNVALQEYTVTAPVTKEATLTLNGRALKVLPVYPNHVMPSSTPRSGLTGTLIYGGMGRPVDYNGKRVNGAIVVLDFNSGLNWITAADLGARAVIFLEPLSTSRGEAERKFASLPVNIPRFYAPRAVADAIRAAGESARATLRSRVVWERVKTYNVVGSIKGTGVGNAKNGNTLVINGYYDSMSITPDLAPGAEAAGNCAALLETARYFQSAPRKPKYDLLFVANGAHHLALAGARNFAAQHFVDTQGGGDKAVLAKIANYRAFIGLDLTSRTDTVGLFAKSWFYNQMSVANESILLGMFSPFSKAVDAYAEAEAKRLRVRSDEFFVNGISGAKGRSWRSYLPSVVALDSEVATMTAKPGISFATANDARLLQDTPFDTIDRMNLPNLSRQIATVTMLLNRSMGDIDGRRTALPSSTSGLKANFGFAVGKAVYRDVTQGGTSLLPDTPIPDANVPETPAAPASATETPEGKANRAKRRAEQREMARDAQAVGYILDRATDSKSYSGVRGALIERAVYSKPDAKNFKPPIAQFIFIAPRAKDLNGGPAVTNEIEAYSINGDGRIIFAPDQGSERQRFNPTFTSPSTNLAPTNKELNEYKPDAVVISFRCRSTALFDTLDQRYFSVLTEMTILDAQSNATPIESGFLKAAAPAGTAEMEPMALVFSKPGSRFKLIMAAGLLGKRLVVLNTAPQEGKVAGEIKPEGVGVLVPGENAEAAAADAGGGVVVPAADEDADAIVHVSYQVARDLWTLNQQRIRQLKFFGINNERVDDLHEMAGGQSTERVTVPKADFRYEVEDKTTKQKTMLVPAIQQAERSLAANQYDQFYMQARRAFGLESRAYPDVEATAQDVLKGIIFYLALLLPFSFFIERLVIGSSDVRKQIFGTSVAFLLVFLCIRFVHPAFELALTPFIILLAFIILALTVVVTIFLSSKFEQEIKRLKQGVHFADVGRLSAISAALGLGIANMRRRPMRTALTCVTLILLTFTVLSFTSVTANITNFARPYGDKPPEYAGLMVRQPDWSPLQEAAVSSMTNEFRLRFGNVAPRAWYLSRDQGEALQLRVSNPEDTNKFFNAPALMGVTQQETEIGTPITKTLVRGKWFDSDRRDVCLLSTWMLTPQNLAETAANDESAAANGAARTELPLGLTLDNAVGSKVQVAGQILEVIGVFDDQKFRAARDLDGEGFTPVDYQKNQSKSAGASATEASKKGEEVEVQTYEHTDANALLVLPYDTVLMMGGTTRSLAAGFRNTTNPTGELNDLMQRAALGIFGATKGADGNLEARLYSSVEGTSYEGFASLLIPILIAALIIANTMLGSVFERTREIGIYSAVGLAPVHVAALFIAEAMVYAVLGSISGYLIAQVVAKIITANNLLPGITLNYSSGSAVLSTLIVMATVLLSTIYPAWAASRMSQPDIDRRWRMSEPFGDVWRFQFPFTVSGQQPVGVAQFLYDFFSAHTDTSVGKFYTDRVIFNALSLREAVELLNALPDDAAAAAASRAKNQSAEETAANQPVVMKLEEIAADPDTEVYRLAMRTWLAPFDMGVSQDSEILLIPSKERGLYELQLKLVRQSGEIAAWKRVNRQFLGDLRKQLLLWRTIKREDQQEYILRGRAHVHGEVVPHEVPGAVPGAVAVSVT